MMLMGLLTITPSIISSTISVPVCTKSYHSKKATSLLHCAGPWRYKMRTKYYLARTSSQSMKNYCKDVSFPQSGKFNKERNLRALLSCAPTSSLPQKHCLERCAG